MPIIKRFRSCVLRINPRDHNPPHFHLVMNDGREAWVDILTHEMYGGVDRREIAEVLAWASAEKDSLLKTFEELKK